MDTDRERPVVGGLEPAVPAPADDYGSDTSFYGRAVCLIKASADPKNAPAAHNKFRLAAPKRDRL